jgi:hypothetical protein
MLGDRDDCSHAKKQSSPSAPSTRWQWTTAESAGAGTARFRIRRVMWKPRSLGRGDFGSSVPVARDVVSRDLERVREAEAVCLARRAGLAAAFGPLSDPSDGVSPADLPLGARSRWMTTIARERDS